MGSPGTLDRRRYDLQIIASLALLFLIAIGVGALHYADERARAWAEHSLIVSRTAERLQQSVEDAETGQRGFLLTGDATYLGPYTEAVRSLPDAQASLKALVRDNPSQEARLRRLDPLIAAKMAELAQTVDLARSGHADAAIRIVRTNSGRDLMVGIRSRLADFAAAEDRLLGERVGWADLADKLLFGLVGLSLLAVAGFAVVIARTHRAHEAELSAQNLALVDEMRRREEAETRLRQAERMQALGQLTGGVAHDFNNLLAVIVGNLDILMRRLGKAEESVIRVLAQNAFDGASRAGDLTRRLLAYSRLQPLDPKPMDVNRCVGVLSELLQRTLGETIVIETVLAAGLWRAFIDAAQFESALLNLAVNARDAMPHGGRLTIETSNAFLDESYAEQHEEVTSGQYVLVAVTDTGSGMSADTIAKAFDPFFTTKDVGHGTGLGLSQVHGFLKQSGGHIKLYSEQGVGTTVKLYLPRDRSDAQLDPSPPPTTQLGRRSYAILVVEDEPTVRGVALNAARELGLEVFEADGAEAALACLESQPGISVVLTDVVMPGTNGRQFAEEAQSRWPKLKIVYMTGYTRNAIIHNGMLDPGTVLLTKPFTVAELERVLRLAHPPAEG